MLILGGTGEAVALAEALGARPGLDVITSLAGRTRAPKLPTGGTRIGGFGGREGLRDYMRRERIGVIVDATHPFATQMSRQAVEAAAEASVPLLRLERPAWTRQPGDDWVEVEDLEAASMEASRHRRVFLTVGASELAPFGQAPDTWFLVRLIDAPQTLPPLVNHAIVLGRGPFALGDELQLLRANAIQAIVAKNSGGEATYAKIAAGRMLHLPVIMVRRPSPPPASIMVRSEAEALAWIEAQLATV